MNLSEIMALTGGSAGIAVLLAVAAAPWLAAHVRTGAPRPVSIPFPRRPLPAEEPARAVAG